MLTAEDYRKRVNHIADDLTARYFRTIAPRDEVIVSLAKAVVDAQIEASVELANARVDAESEETR